MASKPKSKTKKIRPRATSTTFKTLLDEYASTGAQLVIYVINTCFIGRVTVVHEDYIEFAETSGAQTKIVMSAIVYFKPS
jgi:hypothetical protein